MAPKDAWEETQAAAGPAKKEVRQNQNWRAVRGSQPYRKGDWARQTSNHNSGESNEVNFMPTQ